MLLVELMEFKWKSVSSKYYNVDLLYFIAVCYYTLLNVCILYIFAYYMHSADFCTLKFLNIGSISIRVINY